MKQVQSSILIKLQQESKQTLLNQQERLILSMPQPQKAANSTIALSVTSRAEQQNFEPLDSKKDSLKNCIQSFENYCCIWQHPKMSESNFKKFPKQLIIN